MIKYIRQNPPKKSIEKTHLMQFCLFIDFLVLYYEECTSMELELNELCSENRILILFYIKVL